MTGSQRWMVWGVRGGKGSAMIGAAEGEGSTMEGVGDMG